jgi:uncharacterized protein (DUF305 family)
MKLDLNDIKPLTIEIVYNTNGDSKHYKVFDLIAKIQKNPLKIEDNDVNMIEKMIQYHTDLLELKDVQLNIEQCLAIQKALQEEQSAIMDKKKDIE